MATYNIKALSAGGDTYKLKDFRNPPGVYYGTCSTAAGTQTKVVTCAEFTLTTGAVIFVKFDNAQSYNGQAKLNVNGTGAIDVTSYGTTAAVRYCWRAGEIVGFMYNGTNYVMIDAAVSTTTYYGSTKLYTGAGSTSEALSLTPKSLYDLANGSICAYYSASSTYALGDIVRYANNIYVCSTAITTAESWTAAHWTALPTLQAQINAIRQLPSVSSTDNGKVLRVVDGAWAAASLPSASGVSF